MTLRSSSTTVLAFKRRLGPELVLFPVIIKWRGFPASPPASSAERVTGDLENNQVAKNGSIETEAALALVQRRLRLVTYFQHYKAHWVIRRTANNWFVYNFQRSHCLIMHTVYHSAVLTVLLSYLGFAVYAKRSP